MSLTDVGALIPFAIVALAIAMVAVMIITLIGDAMMMARRGRAYGPWVRWAGRKISQDVNLGQVRQLWSVRVGHRHVHVLRVRNHSLEPDGSRKEYWLGVPATCRTPQEAVAWTFGINPAIYRETVAT